MFNKNILFVLLLLPNTLFGVVQRLSSEDLQKIQSGLKQFHEKTGSGDYSPKPSLKSFAGTERKLFVAKMDSFGMDRWFTFETDADIEQLVQGVRQGGGWDVSWYLLEKPWTYDLIKITVINPTPAPTQDDDEQ